MKIALYLNNLDEEYQLVLYRSISTRARELGMDLICIQQERFVDELPSLRKFPSRNFLNVDGVILLTSVLMDQKCVDFEKQLRNIFKGVPFISLSAQIEDIPSVIIRTQNSMKALMDHLINEHHYENLIFIGGPEEHEDNLVRESVFRQSVIEARKTNPKVNGIVLYGDFNEYIAMNVIARYIEDHPDEPADVIVSANDTMAIGILRVVKSLHDKRWSKCAVTGFDDVPGARLEAIPLTTIRQPTKQMGMLAVETIYKLIMHQNTKPLQIVDSSLIIRNSCGCSKEWEDDEVNSRTRTGQVQEYISQIQRERIRTEQIQQHASFFSQRLNTDTTTGEIIENLKSFLGSVNIHTFYLILFPDDCVEVPETAELAYQKDERGEITYTPVRKIQLKEFFSTEVFTHRLKPVNFALHYINSGNQQFGMIVYEADSSVHPQMCSLSILLGSTISRISFIQNEKDRSKELEAEVAKRTQEIVNANKKLAEESQRRIQVEAEVLKISEQERMRFSMDLHDDICQRLAGISMMCKGMSAMQPDLQELSTLIDETLHRTRQYAHDSFPMELESLGMNEAIGNLCHTLQKQSENKTLINYTWNAPDNPPLDSPQKINIFRIIQEALHNTMKHAKATKIDVSVTKDRNMLIFSVADNGKGNEQLNKDPSLTEFKTSTKRGSMKSVGIGLKSMYYRADQIGAICKISSAVDKGTVVTLSVPLK